MSLAPTRVLALTSDRPQDEASSEYSLPKSSALRELDGLLEHVVELDATSAYDEEFFYHQTVALLHDFCTKVRRCELLDFGRDEILQKVEPVRQIFARSPFIRHMQTWPAGYQGDFTIVQHLVDQKNLAPTGTLAYQVERYCLGTGLAQQHRNKVGRQARLVQQTVLKGVRENRPAKILSIACGGSPDIVQALPIIATMPFELVLNDLDAAALAYSNEKLTTIYDRVTEVHGNALTSVNKLAKYGPFDLILVGGLFDYFQDHHIRFFLSKVVASLLGQDATLFFTNLARGNPYRVFIEYFANWFLIERSEQDLHRLGSEVPLQFEIQRDLSDLTFFVEAHRA